MIRWMVFLDACAIVVNDECAPSIFGKQVDVYVARRAMFDGIIHGFLRNVIEMRRHGVVVDQHWCFALEAAADSKQIFNFCCPELESRHEAMGVGDYGQEAACQFARLVDRLIDQGDDLGGVLRLWQTLLVEFLLQDFAHVIRQLPARVFA